MKNLFDRMAVTCFSLLARAKGYRFSVVAAARENEDAEKVFTEGGGYQLPANFQEEMNVYKKDAVKFIAYYHGKPVGTVSLADPKIANRPFDLHGVDGNGDHFEIQSLLVSKGHRECSQLVLLGLFKEMYCYSIKNSINSWISLGLRQLYITLRRYNKHIQVTTMTGNNNKTPLADYLYANNIFDSCATMQVSDFAPAKIFARFIKKQVKKVVNKKKAFFLDYYQVHFQY